MTSALKLPGVWLGIGTVLVVAIIAANMQNSEPSFAIGAPNLSRSEFDCGHSTPLQAQVAPTMREELQGYKKPELAESTDAAVHEKLSSSRNDEAVAANEDVVAANESVSIPLGPEETQASENEEVAEENELLPANDNSSYEDAVSLPDRKPLFEPTLRNVATKEGARSVQRRLRDLGYLAGYVDGSWGPKSRIALKQFQLRAKISSGNGWDRHVERVLFSRNAPGALPMVPSPFVQAHF
jgi:hypothetical protein